MGAKRKRRENVSRNNRDESVTRGREEKRREDLRASTSDVKAPDVDARIEMRLEDRGEVVETCNRVIAIVPLGKEREQNKKDRSLVFKAVLLSMTELSEDWLRDSLEAVKSKKGTLEGPSIAYWKGVLDGKCKAIGLNLNALLKRVVVPADILNGGAP